MDDHLPADSAATGPASPAASLRVFDIAKIMQLLPQRYPFLMIDRITDIVVGESGIGIKNVTINEPFFEGHFPGYPVMPGVLIIEAMAQTAGAIVSEAISFNGGGVSVAFMSVSNAKFRKPIVPGDQLRLHVAKEHARSSAWRFRGIARVEGVMVAEAVFTAMFSANRAD